MFKKILKVVPFIFLAIYISACCFLYFSQEHILFPSRGHTPVEQKYHFATPFEEVWIETDAAKLHALYFHAKQARGIIMFFHGNTESAAQFGDTANEFTDQGFDYFVPDYRGYGKSSGKITNEKQFLNDVEEFYEWASAHYPENKIYVAGRSMGSVPATYLGAKHSPRLTLIIAPFYNVIAMKDIRYPYLPDFLLKYHFPNNLWIKQIKGPVFIIHGTKDRTISYHHSEWLADAAKDNPHRRYFSVPGAGHSNLQDFPLYHKILRHLMTREVTDA